MLLISLTALMLRAPSLAFTPETSAFAAAASEYRDIWTADGARIVAVLERVSGLRLSDRTVNVIIFEGPSYSGIGDSPMRLRASYSLAAKRGTLVHELGHRLIAGLRRDPILDEHRTLFLILYDVWTDLWGPEFADAMVAIERHRRGAYDYNAAWTWALAMTREERQARVAALRNRR